MRIFDVPWINHDGGGIYSLDIHSSGKKLVTAGQDHSGAGLLMVWPLNFLVDDDNGDGCGASVATGHLARIPHSKGLNCARWSRRNPRRLVCAGVDAVVFVYECVGSFTTMSTLGAVKPAGTSSSGSGAGDPAKSKTLENYRCIHRLYGHSMDVQHVDWSPDERFVASSSLDNTVIVWNAERWPERITTLGEANGGHTCGIKGLAWDPMGRFLATQAEDNTLRLWQTDSWECVRIIDEPFQESAGSTLFLRMDWSPDGQYLVSPCAMNNGGPTANVLVRKDWNSQRDFVGFRKAVSCVRANPRCFSREVDDESGECSIVSYFATGSRDRSLAVWIVPAVGRPLLVLEKFFKLSILDLSWNDMTLAACSSDSVVRLLNFTESEIGVPLSSGEMMARSEKIYGFLPDVYKSSLTPTIGTNCGRTLSAGSLQKSALHDNFIYAAWRDAFHNSTSSFLMSGQVESFDGGQKNVFHAKRKVSGAYLRRVIGRAKRRMEHSPTPRDGDAEDAASQEADGGSDASNSDDNLSTLLEDRLVLQRVDAGRFEFAEPALRQQLHAKTVQWRHSGRVRYVTAHNSYSIGRDRPIVMADSDGEAVTRIAAFGDSSTTPLWSVYTPDVVTALSSNSYWMCYATAGGRFCCHSTPTGRLMFSTAFHTPLAQLILDGDHCVVVACDGNLVQCDLKLRKCFTRSLLPLLNKDVQRLTVRTTADGAGRVELSTDGLTQSIFAGCDNRDGSPTGGWEWPLLTPIFDILRRTFYPLPQFASFILSREDHGVLLGHLEKANEHPSVEDADSKKVMEMCRAVCRTAQASLFGDNEPPAEQDEAIGWLLEVLQRAAYQNAKSEARFVVALIMLRIIRNGNASALLDFVTQLGLSTEFDGMLHRHAKALLMEFYDQCESD